MANCIEVFGEQIGRPEIPPRTLSTLLHHLGGYPLAFAGHAVTNRVANATYVLDLGLKAPAVLANSNFVILQPC